MTRHSAHAHHNVEVRSTSRVIYDVTGLLEPIENIEIENEVALAAMTEDNLINQYIARRGGSYSLWQPLKTRRCDPLTCPTGLSVDIGGTQHVGPKAPG